MNIDFKGTEISLIRGDITGESTDAIVNAANPALAGGGGVDGAIHSAGGPEIMAQTTRLYPEGCKTGEAVITRGGKLPSRYVIHTVGPVYRGGKSGEEVLLRSAYRSSLMLGKDKSLSSIAFPSISTGVYGYPLELAAPLALGEVIKFIIENPGSYTLIRFVLFSERDLKCYTGALKNLLD